MHVTPYNSGNSLFLFKLLLESNCVLQNICSHGTHIEHNYYFVNSAASSTLNTCRTQPRYQVFTQVLEYWQKIISCKCAKSVIENIKNTRMCFAKFAWIMVHFQISVLVVAPCMQHNIYFSRGWKRGLDIFFFFFNLLLGEEILKNNQYQKFSLCVTIIIKKKKKKHLQSASSKYQSHKCHRLQT